MEKYDYIVKSAEIRRLFDLGKNKEALEILESMDINKVNILSDLSLFGMVYAKTSKYEKAINVFEKIYDRIGSRRAVYQLIKLYIKTKQLDLAEEFYKIYTELAPNDSECYGLRYLIDKASNKDMEHLIQILEELKAYDYSEKWGYELAKLYHKAGRKEDCIRECGDLILWFGEGIIVDKAKLLKAYYLTDTSDIEELSKMVLEAEAAERLQGEEKEAISEQEQISDQEIEQDIESETEQEIEQDIENETELEIEQDIENETELEVGQEEAYYSQANSDEELDGVEEYQSSEDMVEENQMNEGIEECIEGQEDTILQDDITNQQDKKELDRPIVNDSGISQIFSCYMHIFSLKTQIITNLMNIVSNKEKTNFIITGEEKSGKTYFAKQLAKALYELKYSNTTKIARIDALKLNGIDILTKMESLLDSCVIVENASLLRNETIDNISKGLKQYENRVVFILEDKNSAIEHLRSRCNTVNKLCKIEFDLPEFKEEDYIRFATCYLEKEGYYFSKEVLDIFIELVEKKLHTMGNNKLESIMELTKGVKHTLDKRYMKDILSMMSSRQYEDSNMRMINEEDLDSLK